MKNCFEFGSFFECRKFKLKKELRVLLHYFKLLRKIYGDSSEHKFIADNK